MKKVVETNYFEISELRISMFFEASVSKCVGYRKIETLSNSEQKQKALEIFTKWPNVLCVNHESKRNFEEKS